MFEEYFKDGLTIKIYNCNMTNLINENYDYIITDPPYNIKYKYNDYKDNMKDDEYIKLFSYFKNKKCCFINYLLPTINFICKGIENEMTDYLTWCYNSNINKQSRLISFFNCKTDKKKVLQPYKNLNDKRIKKRIEEGHTGTPIYDWFSDINLIKKGSKEKINNFTNQIPVALIERIILLISNEGDTIYDPFLGTGSTAIACINTKRNFIGAEISPTHFKIADERIKKHLNFNFLS